MIKAIKLTAQLVTQRGRRRRGLVVKEKLYICSAGIIFISQCHPTCLAQLQNSGWWLIL